MMASPLLAAALVVLAYARPLPGIVPDMRYLSPAYLTMLVIGVYSLKYAGLDSDGVREALRTLFRIAVIDLPLIFIILQTVVGNNPTGQVTLVTTLTYIFLAEANLCPSKQPFFGQRYVD